MFLKYQIKRLRIVRFCSVTIGCCVSCIVSNYITFIPRIIVYYLSFSQEPSAASTEDGFESYSSTSSSKNTHHIKILKSSFKIKLYSNMLYSFFLVIPLRLNFMSRRFGTLCSIFLDGVSYTKRVLRKVGT